MLSTYEIKVSKNDKQGFSLIAFLCRSIEAETTVNLKATSERPFTYLIQAILFLCQKHYFNGP